MSPDRGQAPLVHDADAVGHFLRDAQLVSGEKNRGPAPGSFLENIFDNAGIDGTAALPSPLSIDAMANQTGALITTLHLKEANVLGWSMGSMIAQALAIRHPSQVRRLILLATFPGLGNADQPSQKAVNALTSGNPAATQADLFPANQTLAA